MKGDSLMKKRYLLVILGILIVFNLSCAVKEDKSNFKSIENKNPKYKDTDFISLTQLYTINIATTSGKYNILNASWFDVDNSGNLYIMDTYDSKIHIFDSNGNHIKTFGGLGEGPSDLNEPRIISILNEKIYVLERYRGIKIFSLNGKYIDFVSTEMRSLFALKAFEDFFLGLRMSLRQGNPNLRTWSFEKYSTNYEKELQITELKKKSNRFNLFSKTYINSIDSKHNIYFPYSDDEYLVMKYDIKGTPLLSFSRNFKKIPYSQELKDWAMKKSNISQDQIPTYPPVVRCIFVDNKDYIWVLVGECFLDSNGQVRTKSIIDIFNNNGKFLYTFKSDAFSNVSIIKNNKLYSGPSAAGDNEVKVFRITYKYNSKQ